MQSCQHAVLRPRCSRRRERQSVLGSNVLCAALVPVEGRQFDRDGAGCDGAEEPQDHAQHRHRVLGGQEGARHPHNLCLCALCPPVALIPCVAWRRPRFRAHRPTRSTACSPTPPSSRPHVRLKTDPEPPARKTDTAIYPVRARADLTRHSAATAWRAALVSIVVYNLPNRDCDSFNSVGEICCAYDAAGNCDRTAPGECTAGLKEYQGDFIDPIATVLAKYEGKVPM
eukprot:736101-Prymnesium_polylepis.1